MENNDIVITSRIRLARNLKNYKFPIIMSEAEANCVIGEISNALSKHDKNYKLTYIKDLSDIKKNSLIENHIISPALANKKDAGAFLLSPDQKISVMINEEDHIRIQTIEDGLSLRECWEISNNVDDIIEENVDYAFDNELGYITACPTNIGTGMRASVMLHLPALSITNQIDKLLYGVSQLGVAVRGVYGEGTKSIGHLYQISNQGTLGVSEETLIEKINQIVMQIIERENKTRDHLLKNNYDDLEDDFYRAYGLLTNARKISSDEAMKLLSLIKLGSEMGITPMVKGKNIYRLMVWSQPNNISTIEEKELSPKERDKKRAEIIRSELLS